MTNVLLQRQILHASADNVSIGQEAGEQRRGVGRKVAYLFSRLRQADRMRLWIQNNPVPEANIQQPRHMGEAQNEATMPAATAPSRAAGKHALEITDDQFVAQQWAAADHPPVEGRHIADVPVDAIALTVPKHRA